MKLFDPKTGAFEEWADLRKLGVNISDYRGKDLEVFSPVDGSHLLTLACHKKKEADALLRQALTSFHLWKDIPPPKRGELIRRFGEQLRTHKETLARLISVECGKIISEGRGEVQEMIDVCEFATGLSRQLYGLTIASERKQHVMQERWYPLGVVGVISAFNFPAAVWAWNFALAIVCGNSVVWKPSEKTPLTAIACHTLFNKVVSEMQKEKMDIPPHLSSLLIGGAELGELLSKDSRVALVSATGSSRMGLQVSTRVAERFGKSLLELGGNNAVIVSDKADLELATASIVFGAVGTCGQRCTTTRRVIAHRFIVEEIIKRVKKTYEHIIKNNIGDPLSEGTLIGPLIDKEAYYAMQSALKIARKDATNLWFGKRVLEKKYPNAFYVEPALVHMEKQTSIVREETFAPILYIMPYRNFDEAMAIHNDVPQGLSSAIFTRDITEAEKFRNENDCGIANVNIGTSGAEIGGAFGGEKETGGGRESGSDSWKNYMRRQTSTLYFGIEKPELAQNVRFDV